MDFINNLTLGELGVSIGIFLYTLYNVALWFIWRWGSIENPIRIKIKKISLIPTSPINIREYVILIK